MKTKLQRTILKLLPLKSVSEEKKRTEEEEAKRKRQIPKNMST